MVLKKYLTALMLGSLLLVSCQDELSSNIVINGAKVRAACSSKESPATKGAPLTAVPDNFSVWGYVWKTSGGSQTTPGWMPDKFFMYYSKTTYNWNNLPWMNNFWNAAMTADASLADDQASAVKTIYDPCPAGWMLRSGRASTGFTTTGSRTTFPSECNVIGSFANGWMFKKNASDAVGTYYPASGYRYYASGGLGAVGSSGCWWSYAPYSQLSSRYLLFDSGSVAPLYYNYRAYGFSVRPALEQ